MKIEILKIRLLEEQEKIIALETYSRRENLRFMNVPERNDENCMDVVYDIIENDMNINVEDIHFHAVHRVGKPRSEDASKSFPRPIIARFLSREDRDAVFRERNRLKDSSRAKDVYITQDYAKAIQQERKVLIKAMFQAKERGLSAKVINRKHVGYVLAKQTIKKLSYVPLLLLFNFVFSMPYWRSFSFAIKRAFENVSSVQIFRVLQ